MMPPEQFPELGPRAGCMDLELTPGSTCRATRVLVIQQSIQLRQRRRIYRWFHFKGFGLDMIKLQSKIRAELTGLNPGKA